MGIDEDRGDSLVVEHSLRTREVPGSIPDRVIPKTLKMVLTADVCVMLRTSIGVRNAKSPKTRTPIFLHSKSLRQSYNPESVGLAFGGSYYDSKWIISCGRSGTSVWGLSIGGLDKSHWKPSAHKVLRN